MSKIKIPTLKRNCDLCGSMNIEELWSYNYNTKTQTKEWEFMVNNAICKDCGFAFVSPVSDPEYLISYYNDSFSKYSEQKADYDIEKRLLVIDKYFKNKNKVYIEIGANVKTKFHEILSEKFEKIITIEPNSSAQSDFNSINDAAEQKASCLTHYFVLEHVPFVDVFFKQCNSLLDDDGLMICEVPNISLYSKYLSALILFEHVNHFSVKTLEMAANKNGFQMIEYSHENCSRDFGFVAIFKKNRNNIINNYENEYLLNKQHFINGLIRYKEFNITLDKCKELIKSKSGSKVVIWAANETTRKLIDNFQLTENITIVDSDKRKKDYFLGHPEVYKPDEVSEIIRNADFFVICTSIHAEDIIKSISDNYNRVLTLKSYLIIDL